MTEGTGRAEESDSPLSWQKRLSAQRWIDTSEEMDNEELLPPKRKRLSTSTEDPWADTERDVVENYTCPSLDHSTREEPLRQSLVSLGEANTSPSPPTTSLALPSSSNAAFVTNVRKQESVSFSPPAPVLASFEELSSKLHSVCAGQQAIMKALADHSNSVRECFDQLGNQLAAQHNDMMSVLSSCTAALSSLKPLHTSPAVGVISAISPVTLQPQVEVLHPGTSSPLPVTDVVQVTTVTTHGDGRQLEDNGSMTPDGLVPED